MTMKRRHIKAAAVAKSPELHVQSELRILLLDGRMVQQPLDGSVGDDVVGILSADGENVYQRQGRSGVFMLMQMTPQISGGSA